MRALRRAGIDWNQVGAVELNEAFAVQSIVCVDAWLEQGLKDPELVNTRGGAIALGHPFGSTGARIMTTLVNAMQRHDVEFGLETMCVGGGQGMAMVVERLS